MKKPDEDVEELRQQVTDLRYELELQDAELRKLREMVHELRKQQTQMKGDLLQHDADMFLTLYRSAYALRSVVFLMTPGIDKLYTKLLVKAIAEFPTSAEASYQKDHEDDDDENTEHL